MWQCHGEKKSIEAKADSKERGGGLMRHLTPRLPMVLLAALTCLLAFVGQAVERELHAEDAKAVLPDWTSGTQTTTATPDTQQVPVLTPWRMFRHDARHTGRSPFIGAQTSTIK